MFLLSFLQIMYTHCLIRNISCTRSAKMLTHHQFGLEDYADDTNYKSMLKWFNRLSFSTLSKHTHLVFDITDNLRVHEMTKLKCTGLLWKLYTAHRRSKKRPMTHLGLPRRGIPQKKEKIEVFRKKK